jgi:hypothetical protein
MNIKITIINPLSTIPLYRARYHEKEAVHYMAMSKVTHCKGLADKYMNKCITHECEAIESNLDYEIGVRFYNNLKNKTSYIWN